MYLRNLLLVSLVALVAVAGSTVRAADKELTFAFQGDANSMDPYNLNETFTLGYLGNIYEGLVRRGADLSIQPALAVSWKIVEPTRWRFKLRKGVKFHDGSPFTADDVIFSAQRVQGVGSDLKTRLAGVTNVIKVDDYTVDFVTAAPNPILHFEWSTWGIMSKIWATKNGALTAQSATGDVENFATRNANGTGPFRVISREADVQTVAVAFPGWWDNANKKHNLSKVTLKPIGSDATRVAALLSGQVNMAYPIPVQDMDRVNADSNASVLVGPELRTIFLGMDQYRDQLYYSNVKGSNPFMDIRVRQAFYLAINANLIKDKVMRGLSTPSPLMVAPGINGGDQTGFFRLSFDPDKARSLLAAAGYPNGFEVGMDCPNDRYVNDEAICLAVVSMLAKVGVKVKLLAQPKALYFKKVLAPNLDTSFYLLGWTPGSFDSWNVLFNLHGCYDEKSGNGKFNLGRYCNNNVDALTAKILSETDATKRTDMIRQAWKITTGDVAYIPLHQQALAWGVRKGVNVKQRADNQFSWRHVTMD